jgi:hypothetical protein
MQYKEIMSAVLKVVVHVDFYGTAKKTNMAYNIVPHPYTEYIRNRVHFDIFNTMIPDILKKYSTSDTEYKIVKGTPFRNIFTNPEYIFDQFSAEFHHEFHLTCNDELFSNAFIYTFNYEQSSFVYVSDINAYFLYTLNKIKNIRNTRSCSKKQKIETEIHTELVKSIQGYLIDFEMNPNRYEEGFIKHSRKLFEEAEFFEYRNILNGKMDYCKLKENFVNSEVDAYVELKPEKHAKVPNPISVGNESFPRYIPGHL